MKFPRLIPVVGSLTPLPIHAPAEFILTSQLICYLSCSFYDCRRKWLIFRKWAGNYTENEVLRHNDTRLWVRAAQKGWRTAGVGTWLFSTSQTPDLNGGSAITMIAIIAGPCAGAGRRGVGFQGMEGRRWREIDQRWKCNNCQLFSPSVDQDRNQNGRNTWN